MSERPVYCPIPARAMGDHRLAGAELRVLMAIAAHDRFGANGTGCYASHLTLAKKVGLNAKSVARSIGRLRDIGYLTVARNPLNGRLVVYSVIYSDEDDAAMRGNGQPGVRAGKPKAVPKTGNQLATGRGGARAATGNRLATGREGARAATGNRLATDNPPIGNQDFQEIEADQGVTSVNIFPERGKILGEAARRGKASGAGALIDDARRISSDALSGALAKRQALDRLRRVLGRVEAWADVEAERSVLAILRSVEADAPAGDDPPPLPRAVILAPMERRALAEAAQRGEPPPPWVRRAPH